MTDWYIYTGVPGAEGDLSRLPPPPPWRTFAGGPALPPPDPDPRDRQLAVSYLPDGAAVEQINAALYLRRPLLVTGRPGTGKSSLAYSVATELGLGKVLYWPITSRVTVKDGLYSYDPLTRLYRASRSRSQAAEEDLGRYIRLGPLGTALLPYRQPRVLLIDEVDKGDIDFPNDLLTIFEKGEFEIPELARNSAPTSTVMTADGEGSSAPVSNGMVRCLAFPLVIMTSNGERQFPAAFLRRCMQVELAEPDGDRLRQIVELHLADMAADSQDRITQFLERKSLGQLATDQLLHAVYLTHHAARAGTVDLTGLAERVMPFISEGTSPDDG